MRDYVFTLQLGVTIYLAANLGVVEAIAEEVSIDFAREIQPIFARRCFKCHGPGEAEGGLRLNSRAATLAELESGLSAVVPGSAEKSAILHRITSDDPDERMPPDGKPLAIRVGYAAASPEPGERSAEALLASADQALLAAKRAH